MARKNRNILGVIGLSLFALCLGGCGNTYTFNNQSYSSSEAALTAHAKYLEDIEADIVPIDNQPNGTAVIITPSKKTCEALGITRTGHPKEELVTYLGEYLEDDYAYFGNFLIKGNVFKSVEHEITDFPQQRARALNNKYSATIYLELLSPTQSSWRIIIPPESKSEQINMDGSAKPGAPQIQSWINDIHTKVSGGM
jgi:hypothetical protein